jgi:hypothetical protein
MRQPFEIYRKYKYLLKKEMNEEIDKSLKVLPENCTYNKEIDIGERGKVRLCTLGQKVTPVLETGGLLVCEKCEQARACIAYAAKHKSREEATLALAEELKDPAEKRKRFPDLIALEWVMDNSMHGLKKDPPTKRHRYLLKVITKVESFLLYLEEKYRKL